MQKKREKYDGTQDELEPKFALEVETAKELSELALKSQLARYTELSKQKLEKILNNWRIK